jgi:hypothetical protein
MMEIRKIRERKKGKISGENRPADFQTLPEKEKP